MRTFNLEDSDVIAIHGALTGYQAELLEESKSTDKMERETAIADLAHVERLLVIFNADGL